jgi:tetratricopeptide (TPR) repeat protein
MKSLPKILFIISFLLASSVYAQLRGYEAIKQQGISHMNNGKYGEAIDLFNKYIAKNAQEPEGYNLRGLCHEKRQIYKYAVLDFRRAIHLTQKNKEYRLNLIRVISIWYPLLRKKIEGHKREIAIDKYSAFDYLEIGKSYRWLEEWATAEL